MRQMARNVLQILRSAWAVVLLALRLAIFIPFGAAAAVAAGLISTMAAVILLHIPLAEADELAALATLAAAGSVLPAASEGRHILTASLHAFLASALTITVALALVSASPTNPPPLAGITVIALIMGGLFSAAGPATAPWPPRHDA